MRDGDGVVGRSVANRFRFEAHKPLDVRGDGDGLNGLRRRRPWGRLFID